MKRSHSPAAPTSLDLMEALPSPQQQPSSSTGGPCPLMLLRRPRTASQPICVSKNNTKTSRCEDNKSAGVHGGDTITKVLDTHHHDTTTCAVSQPTVLRALSESCMGMMIPRAPRMSSSVPNQVFLDSLPQLDLPPPSVEEAEAIASSEAAVGGRVKLSSSLRERMSALNLMHFSGTSCPGALSDVWEQRDKEAEGVGPEAQNRGAASLTALSILVSKAFSAGEATLGKPRMSPVSGGSSSSLNSMHLPPPAVATGVSSSGDVAQSDTAGGHPPRKEREEVAASSSSYTAFTASTAATTASSVSSAEGLDDDEDAASATSSTAASAASASEEAGADGGGSPSADAAMGPFDLEELDGMES